MATEPLRTPLTDVNKPPSLRSRLPTPNSKRFGMPAQTSAEAEDVPPPQPKRKAEADNPRPMKKARLNSSTVSDPGVSMAAPEPRSRNFPAPRRPAATSTTRGATTRAKPAPTPTTTKPAARSVASSKPPAAAPATSTGDKKASSSKRPAWDVKGRLQDMEAKYKSQERLYNDLQTQMLKNTECMEAMQYERSNLQGTVSQKNQAVDTLEKQLRESQQELDEINRSLGRKVSDLEFEKSTLERQRTTLQGELSASQQEASALKASVATLTASQSGMSAELTSTKSHLEQSLLRNSNLETELADLKAKYSDLLEEHQHEMQSHETERRKLHNMVQELKGNIRVFCRVRPLLGDELHGTNGQIQHLVFPDESRDKKCIQVDKLVDGNSNEAPASGHRGSSSSQEFSFDRVFSPSAQQSEVFEEISQLVQSALDGYHVCIFAYGQTGSGKTYTMEGPNDPDDETKGMIPRAVEQVFSSTQSLEDKGWQYKFEVSFMEIYNQTIRDLLGSGADVKHDIRLVNSNSSEVTVTNMTSVEVAEPAKVYQLLNKASKNRAVAETKCNSRSSRSHSIFQMKITGQNSETGESCSGMLNLIDLAGSERLKDSGSEGQRLKEAQAINTSLSNLGNVIVALANKESHIPYRNSKLTHVLQHCLGGNGKVLMFANVSPKAECYSETINSLRFATKVNNCNIGTASQSKK